MTNKPLTDLSPTELRIRCAEVLGWRTEQKRIRKNGHEFYVSVYEPRDPLYPNIGNELYGWRTNEHYLSAAILRIKKDFYPHYDASRNALQELILAVPEEKRGHFISFIWEFSGNFGSDSAIEAFWKLLTAPPEAVMRAFLSVMEE
jgi:hypothetical protein